MIFQFAYPWVLGFLIAYPLIQLISLRKRSESADKVTPQGVLPPGIPSLLAGGKIFTSPPSASLRIKMRFPLIHGIRFLSISLFIIALARPQFGTYQAVDPGVGRDLLLTLDVSGSMSALDFLIDGQNVSRLSALKTVVADFIKARSGDRLGIMVFGKDVYTKSPLTTDTLSLLDHLKDLEIGMAGDATSLGDALLLSVKRIKDIPGESKAIVLVTDGVRSSGQLEPIEAASIAKKLGVKVYTIGIGTGGRVPFPTSDLFGREIVTYQEIPLDEKTLKEIASLTGGLYFNAQSTSELKKVYDEINTLEPREDPEIRLITQREVFVELLLLGIFCFVLVEVLERTFLRVNH